jgi:hypothetical protein
MKNDKVIPQVNQGVTDENREQSRRICELHGLLYKQISGAGGRIETSVCYKAEGKYLICVDLPNGSFTLCQAWEMLKVRGVEWSEYYDDPNGPEIAQGWHVPGTVVSAEDPVDLTAAMDALIKLLEEKNG